jgi:hypothetical protein
MLRTSFIVAYLLSVPLTVADAEAPTALETDSLQIDIDTTGRVVGLLDKTNGQQNAFPDRPSPLLQVRIAETLREPERMEWNADRRQMTLHYGPVSAVVQVAERSTHVRFELIAVEPLDAIDRVQWGPIATRISANVGEVIGVVRDEHFAIGLQVLNPKTLGGTIDRDEGRIEGRGKTALKTEWGSTLQAFSLDRSRPRKIDVWGGHFPRMPVPPIPGETVIGSRIALFGCPGDRTLDQIGKIEVAERLPHPEFDGTWSRTNPQMGRAYLITEFSEENFPELLDYAQRGGFHSVYHGHPFQSWGHYELRRDHFPRGTESMKACVAAAAERGISVGVHTLTNFINTSDPYVTPAPDPRLAKTGSSTLVADIDAEQTEIEVADPEYFANQKANWLRTIVIGQELIRYGAVSEELPWKLQNLQRGAWGTRASAHAAGDEVGKLLDHPYQVFFPNYEMQQEIARRLADLINETGIGHFDFDGHEGCWASGQGSFAEEMFAYELYKQLKKPVHNGSSRILPFYWHINTNTNWGEPWYGGFRGSMAEYRVNNQALFDRNFMPHMMGWFLLTGETTLADIEWLMARNAGYDAGFALSASLPALRGNPHTHELLDTIATWEKLRLAGVFTEAQRARLRDTDQEFHLEQIDPKTFRLHAHQLSSPFRHEHALRQPGEPTGAMWEYDHPAAAQPLQFTLRVEGAAGEINNAVLEYDNYLRLELPPAIDHGQSLVCDGNKSLRIFDASGRQIGRYELKTAPPEVKPGRHTFGFTCEFSGEPTPKVSVQFKALSEVEEISLGDSK